MKYTYKLFEDNAGFRHLAVMDGDSCIYYLCDGVTPLVMDTLADLKAGGDPIADCWEGGEEDPELCLAQITALVDARNGGAWEVDA